jgi:hypothetical protein
LKEKEVLPKALMEIQKTEDLFDTLALFASEIEVQFKEF